MKRKWLVVGGVVFSLFTKYSFTFEKKDLTRMKQRMDFYEKGNYAISLPKYDRDSKKFRGGKLHIYYVSKNFYDSIFNMYFQVPITIKEEEGKTTFLWKYTQLELTPDGVFLHYNRKFPEERKGLIFCLLYLSPVRFDDSISYRKKAEKWESFTVRPYEIVKRDIKGDEKKQISKFSNMENIKPTYIIKTEEGLWTLWEFNFTSSGIKGTYSPDAALILPSGPGAAFYNTVQTIKKDAYIDFKMKLKIVEDKKFPARIKQAKELTLFDTHTHRTILTDLRDCALMARKHGYKYGLLSILYNEKPYGRLFLGDKDMFNAVKRYPDIFVGLGLIQLNSKGYPGFPRKGPDTPEHIKELWEKGCKGIKTLEKWSGVDVSDEKFDPVYKEIARYKMPIVFHTNAEGSGCANTKVAKVAEKFPDIPVIMAHLYNEEQLEKIIPFLKNLPNLYIQHMHLIHVKTKDGKSALKRLIEEGLAEKIIFGSDVQNDYSCLMRDSHNFVKELKKNGVSDGTIEKIMFKTAEKLFSNVKEKGDK